MPGILLCQMLNFVVNLDIFKMQKQSLNKRNTLETSGLLILPNGPLTLLFFLGR